MNLHRFVCASALLACLPLIAQGAGTASRAPALPDNSPEVVTNQPGLIQLNPGRTPVVSNDNYTSITSVEVDSPNGIIRGFADFDMDIDQVLPLGTAIGSQATGGIAFEGVAAGPAAFDMTVNLAFDGQFIVNDGSPSLSLTGNINATTFGLGLPLSGTVYQSQLMFELSVADGNYVPNTIFTGVAAPLGGDNAPYAGASVNIISDTVGNLDAILSLTFNVQPGDNLIISSLVIGIAAPEPGDGPLEDGLDVRASAGAVDFFNTGVVGIVIPEGASLIGNTDADNALLANVLQVQPVPIPAAAIAFAPAVLVLTQLRRRTT